MGLADDNDEMPAGGRAPLSRKEWLLLLVLGSIQFTHILDFMIVMPLGPKYMDKEAMALTPEQFGFMVSAYAFSACITGLIAAWCIDRFDRRTALLFLYAGFAVGTLCCAAAPNYGFLVAARIVTGGFGGVVNATVLTIVGDLFHDTRRGRAMGVIMSAFSLASIAGVPAGLMLADAIGWQAPFAALGLACLGVLAGVFMTLPSVRGHLERDYRNILGQFITTIIDPGHLRAYALMSILVLGMFTIVPFMATFLVRNVGCPETDLKYMYLCGGLATLFTMQGIGWLADRFSKLWLFRILAVLTMVPILVVTNLPPTPLATMLACTTLFMIVTSARMVPFMALITASAQPRLRGSFMSVIASVQQMAMGVGAQLSSLIIHERADGQLIGFSIVGVIAAATTLLCAYLVGYLRPVVVHAVDIEPKPREIGHVHRDGIQPAAPTEITAGRHG